jgi:hypothetical protein
VLYYINGGFMTEEIDNLLDYLQRAGLNTISIDSPAWKLLHKVKKKNKIDKTIRFGSKKIVDKTIRLENGQKLSIGKLVRHRTVPALGLGLVVAESKTHKGFWMIQWCDSRYYDVGNLGIDENYLEIV